jgi:micrococcal nuclease
VPDPTVPIRPVPHPGPVGPPRRHGARPPAALAVLVALLTACGWAPRVPVGPGASGPDAGAGAGEAAVVRVIDGDTLVARLGPDEEHVRLIGIDTPETKKPGTPVECFGVEASAHLTELLPPGTVIRLERDIEDRDRYGRLLAYVHRLPDDLFVNHAMVADGFAAAYTVPPNVARVDEIGEAARAARSAGLGLWGRCGGGHEPAPP